MKSLERFSREHFHATHAERLCHELAAVLAEQLRACCASDRIGEIRAIIDELRRLGHDLWSWDGSDEAVIWGGDYIRPQPLRMLLTFGALDEEEPTVEVIWGPWPGKGT